MADRDPRSSILNPQLRIRRSGAIVKVHQSSQLRRLATQSAGSFANVMESTLYVDGDHLCEHICRASARILGTAIGHAPLRRISHAIRGCDSLEILADFRLQISD
jgi:hypothetical protein